MDKQGVIDKDKEQIRPSDVRVNVRSIAFGGAGVGEVVEQTNGGCDLLGITAFVPFSAAGEKVSAKVIEQKKRFIKTALVDVNVSSPQRVEPACEYFKVCGGCELQHLNYQEQLRSKNEMIRGAFRSAQFGAGVLDTIADIVPSKEYGYRRRVSLHVNASGGVGFYREKTRSIVSVKHCEIASPAISKVLTQIQDFGNEIQGKLSSILLEEDAHGIIAVLKSPYSLAQAELQLVLNAAKKYFKNVLVLVGEKEVGGFGRQILELPLNERGTYTLKIPAGNFSQVNWDVNLKLIAETIESAQIKYEQTVFDLYAGAGNFAVPLARGGAKVVAVECNPRLAAFVRENANKENLSKRLSIEELSVEKFLQSKRKEPVDLIVADPPRSGIGSLVSELSFAKRLILISCYLPSLVRDIKGLEQHGWSTEKIVPFDMFPQTSYVEVLAVLNRNRSGVA